MTEIDFENITAQNGFVSLDSEKIEKKKGEKNRNKNIIIKYIVIIIKYILLIQFIK